MSHVEGVLNIYATFGTSYDIVDVTNFGILISEGLKHTVVIGSLALRTFGVQHEGELRSMAGKGRYGTGIADRLLKEEVRKDNFMLTRCHQVLDLLRESGVHSAMVTRAVAKECCPPTILDEYADKRSSHKWNYCARRVCVR